MRSKIIGLSLMLCPLTTALATEASVSPPLPKSMVSIGDSITAGAIANFSRSQFYNPFYLLKMLGTLGEIGVKMNVYGAIQDRHLSWATGLSSDYSVTSHAQRLAYLHAKAGTQMNVTSVSWSGDTSYNLESQVDRALEWSVTKSGDAGPDYVTILIGANDICAGNVNDMTPDRDFYNNVDTAVSRIINANPNAKVVISSLPDVNSLHKVAKRSMLMGIAPLQRCEDFWRKTNLCYTLTRVPAGTVEEQIVGDKVIAMNRILSDITDRANAQGTEKRVAFSPTVYEQKFTDKDISIDCFHPNQKGQNILAESTWKDGFWAKDFDANAYKKYVAKIKAKRARPVGPRSHY